MTSAVRFLVGIEQALDSQALAKFLLALYKVKAWGQSDQNLKSFLVWKPEFQAQDQTCHKKLEIISRLWLAGSV